MTWHLTLPPMAWGLSLPPVPLVRAGRRTAAKQSAAPLPPPSRRPIKEALLMMRADAQPINFCPNCGAMYTGSSHTCRRAATRQERATR
jgi:hypothetical protein